MKSKGFIFPCIGILLVGGAIYARGRISTNAENHEKMQRGGADAAQHVLDSGSDVNAKESLGQTPLMAAARSGNIEQVQAMLAKGADVNAADDSDKTAFTWTTYMYKVSLSPKYTHIARAIIDKGLDLERKDRRGKTPLMIALGNRALDTASYLVEKGADVKARDKEGHTALHWVLKAKPLDPDCARIVGQLLKAGADPNATAIEKRTPYSIAAALNMTQTAKALKAAGGK